MKRLLLVRPNVANRFQIVPSPGLGYVAEAAKRAGYTVAIHDAWLWNHSPRVAAELCIFDAEIQGVPEIIGVQVFCDTVEWTREFISWLRKPSLMDSTRIIIGGPQPSAHPAETRKQTGADEVVTGPGELFFGEIPDIPAWELMDLPLYWPYMQSATIPIRGKRPASIITSRGCHHHCTFCAGHVVHGRTPLLRTPQSVMKEILDLKHTYKVDEIWFHDDNFLYDRDRAMRILDWLKTTGLHLRFPNGIRCENLDEDVAKLMRLAGVYMVGIGIESGSPRVLRECKKGLRLQVIRDAVQIFHDYGIMTSGFFIVGLPPERKEDVEDSVAFALSLPLDRVQVGTFIPYPGSEDAQRVSQMDTKTLRKLQRHFTLRFYLRPRIIFSMLRHIRWSQIKALLKHPWLRGK